MKLRLEMHQSIFEVLQLYVQLAVYIVQLLAHLANIIINFLRRPLQHLTPRQCMLGQRSTCLLRGSLLRVVRASSLESLRLS